MQSCRWGFFLGAVLVRWNCHLDPVWAHLERQSQWGTVCIRLTSGSTFLTGLIEVGRSAVHVGDTFSEAEPCFGEYELGTGSMHAFISFCCWLWMGCDWMFWILALTFPTKMGSTTCHCRLDKPCYLIWIKVTFCQVIFNTAKVVKLEQEQMQEAEWGIKKQIRNKYEDQWKGAGNGQERKEVSKVPAQEKCQDWFSICGNFLRNFKVSWYTVSIKSFSPVRWKHSTLCLLLHTGQMNATIKKQL